MANDHPTNPPETQATGTTATVLPGDDGDRAGATTVDASNIEEHLQRHRRELTGYCYRMLGSSFEADDAVQETMVRAWKGFERFEGRSAVRSWLYRIATNVCLDMLRSSQRRARPVDLSPSSTMETVVYSTRAENTWIEPMPDAHLSPAAGEDPADVAVDRETVRLAFIAALQELPPRQRAVLILREVLRWKASEVAALLDTTVASVNSALQRARATIEASELAAGGADGAPSELPGDGERELLGRYLDAFESFDIDALVALLHDDAMFSMPPFDMWFRGIDDIRAFHLGPGHECKDSIMVPVAANGDLALAQYRTKEGGGYRRWGIQVIETVGGKISTITCFLDTNLFDLFGLPDEPDEAMLAAHRERRSNRASSTRS